MDHETANALSRAGKIGETIGAILEDLKPEAAYFAAMGGKRTGIIIVNIDDPSEIPRSRSRSSWLSAPTWRFTRR